ncbi:MAG: 6-bladed beta-propeller [Candidatus Margulisbacteria bacterium]|nr:6-bladed beta-propeller [Candidatus Margulisiibacteriota bacterium]
MLTSAIKITTIISSAIIIISCNSNKSQEMNRLDKIVDISGAVTSREKINLSEIVDSISFLILETNDHNMISSIDPIFMSDYIFNYNICFDKNGKYQNSIGTKGRGPLEEPFGVSRVVHIDGFYYSLGSKFIEYGLDGKPTGNVRVIHGGQENTIAEGRFSRISDFFQQGKTIFLYSFPDTLFFFNTDFDLTNSVSVAEPINIDHYTPPPIGRLTRFMTGYNDTTVFYNYINDTIYHIAEGRITPSRVVMIDPKYKIHRDFFYKYKELLIESERAWSSGRLDQCRLVEISDNRPLCMAVYETSRYLFFIMTTVINFPKQRGIEKGDIYVIYHDKSTGITRGSQANGFYDDILGLEYLMPLYGAFDDKIVKIVWPYEILDHIRICNENNIDVNPLLLDLSKIINEDGNPLLILGHLKN